MAGRRRHSKPRRELMRNGGSRRRLAAQGNSFLLATSPPPSLARRYCRTFIRHVRGGHATGPRLLQGLSMAVVKSWTSLIQAPAALSFKCMTVQQPEGAIHLSFKYMTIQQPRGAIHLSFHTWLLHINPRLGHLLLPQRARKSNYPRV